MHARLFVSDNSNPDGSLMAQVRKGVIILIKNSIETELSTYESSIANGGIDVLNLTNTEKEWLSKMKPIIGGEISRQAGHNFVEGDIILVPVLVKSMTPAEQAAAGNPGAENSVIVYTKIPIYNKFTENGQGRPVFKAVSPDRHRYGTEYSVASPTTMLTRNGDEIQTKGVMCICISDIPEDTIMFRVVEVRPSTLLVRAVSGDEVENLFPHFTYQAPRLSRHESIGEPIRM
jgi:hypothetical protein